MTQRKNECACSASRAIWASRPTILLLQTQAGAGFSADTTSFFLQEVCQPRSLWEEALKRKQVRRISLPCFTCSTSVHTCYHNSFFVKWDMCRMWFERNSLENRNLNCFGLGLSLQNENKSLCSSCCCCWFILQILKHEHQKINITGH